MNKLFKLSLLTLGMLVVPATSQAMVSGCARYLGIPAIPTDVAFKAFAQKAQYVDTNASSCTSLTNKTALENDCIEELKANSERWIKNADQTRIDDETEAWLDFLSKEHRKKDSERLKNEFHNLVTSDEYIIKAFTESLAQMSEEERVSLQKKLPEFFNINQ